MTNTPALGAAQQILLIWGHHQLVSQMGMGYAMAYPFGICGDFLLVMWLIRLFFKINVDREAKEFDSSHGQNRELLQTMNVAVRNPNLNGLFWKVGLGLLGTPVAAEVKAPHRDGPDDCGVRERCREPEQDSLSNRPANRHDESGHHRLRMSGLEVMQGTQKDGGRDEDPGVSGLKKLERSFPFFQEGDAERELPALQVMTRRPLMSASYPILPLWI